MDERQKIDWALQEKKLLLLLENGKRYRQIILSAWGH
jgi:hypothetical protein